MANTPLVSVILPSYNHAKYIEAAILSVANQTYKNIELIVIDDGSSDDSGRVISALQERFKFRFIEQENRGVAKTIERALTLASGKYVSPFSSDDVYLPTKLEKLVGLLEEHPQSAVAYGRIELIDAAGRRIKEIREPYRSGNVYRNLIRGDFYINGLAALVRRDIYSAALTMNTYVDDLPIWLKIARTEGFIYCDEVLAQYRRHDNHLSGDLMKMIEGEARVLASHKDSPEYNAALKRWNLKWFYSCSLGEKRLAAKKYLPAAISLENLLSPKLWWGLVRLALFWKRS